MRPCAGLMLALLLACGGGGGDDPYGESPTGPTGNTPNTPNPNTPPSTSASVDMISSGDGYGGAVHAFSPARVTVARGGTVTWSNGSGFAHNVTFSSANAPPHVDDITAGSVSRTFPTAGTFGYSCGNHAGMSGEVVVP